MIYDDETIEELAATVVHEIKNPVSLALANLYMIKTDDRDRRYTKYCEVIEKELYKISGMATEFLSMSGSSDDMERADLSKLLDNIVEEFKSAGSRRIVYTPGPSVHVLCNKRKISMVFTNLIKNAVEATGEDGIIEISAVQNDMNAIITVKDNGSGFSEEAIILTPGYTSKTNGSGLGLRICRSAIARHGGSMELRNNDEHGATVLVSLPKAPDPF